MTLTTVGESALRTAMRTVKSMNEAEAPFERVEAYVEACAYLDDAEHALLWLYAWCRAEPHVVAAELGRPLVAAELDCKP